MRSELTCSEIRAELSARLDGEVDPTTARLLDDHLASCGACRIHEGELERVRNAVRLQPTQAVPDLSEQIMNRVAGERGVRIARREWHVRARLAAIAAAAAALVFVGSSLPWLDRPTDAAEAGEIAHSIRAAARALDSYRASFEIVERGWHPLVRERTFSASIWFDAPESFALQVRDLTAYPDARWPRNDVDLVANARRSWIREPSLCPPAALPGCAIEPSFEERSVVARKPFDRTAPLPTDIILPLKTLATSDFEVIAQGRLLGRATYRVSLPYRQAVPLVAALQPGGSWRPFHPLDDVEVWIDQETYFPLRFEVRAGPTAERAAWVAAAGLAPEPAGAPLLEVEATSLSEADIAGRRFRAPVGGVVRSGGFHERRGVRSLPPLAGLDAYREGTTSTGLLLAYADGMTWLRVEYVRPSKNVMPVPLTTEEIHLPTGYVYYEPADESFGRRVEIFGRARQVRVESNLPRGELLEVVQELGVAGERARRVMRRGGAVVQRVEPSFLQTLSFVRRPRYLPDGYPLEPTSVVLTGATEWNPTTATIYYRRPEAEFEGFGIRITQSRATRLLPPSSEQFVAVPVDGGLGRWSAERGELEWIEQGVYRAVAVPSFDLATALRVAEGLR